ncbi:hypothetical protein BDW68DRAFT_183033 [Aspergillus falconensis]
MAWILVVSHALNHDSKDLNKDPLGLPCHRSPYVWGPDIGTGRLWTSKRFREGLKQESQTCLGAQHPLNIANYQHIAIGISWRFLRPSSAFPNNIQMEREPEMAAIGANKDLNGIGDIADKQARHTPHVAGIVPDLAGSGSAGSAITAARSSSTRLS